MMTTVRGSFHHFVFGLLFALSLCLAGGLLMVMQAQAGGRGARPAAQAQAAPAPQSGPAYVAGEVLVRLKAASFAVEQEGAGERAGRGQVPRPRRARHSAAGPAHRCSTSPPHSTAMLS